MFNRLQRDEDGFTLIELLVVVIIIGILAAIAIPTFLNQRERGWQAELTSTVRNVALEVEAAATQSGGDYSSVTAGDVQDFLDGIQGSASDAPVTISGFAATQNEFYMCGDHSSFGTTANRVVYDSDAGGLQDFEEVDC